MGSKFEVMNENEMLEVDGGISLLAVGVGILGVSALISTINGYIDESLK